ncbi:MAG: DNA mismatch repair protein MutS [Verrucomicrobia bacterium]|nr:DNA mismatch repair protein MutS [Verrucomicrobiota bacterium]
MTIDTDHKISPMMAQWHACKKNAQDSILLFRLGDFYEAFYEDAVLLSKELDLTLTKRQDIPMAGVPFHASEGYIDKLVAKGYSIAIAEQMEDPRSVKGLVKREIVRVVTPGTIVNSTLLSDKSNNFLACVAQVGEIHGLSILDLTTADFKAMEFDDVKELADELCRLSPKEILLPEKWQKKHADLLEDLKAQLGAAISIKEDWHFDHAHACDVLLRHFRVHNLDGFGLKGMVPAINASGAILHYVREDLNLTVEHIKSIATEHLSRYLLLDRSTQKNLELFESIHDGKKNHTLLNVLDQTETPMGGRLLKNWLTHPLLSVEEIGMRQDGIAALMGLPSQCAEIRVHLKEIRDLERLMMRIETGYASPRDLAGLRFSLEHIAPLSKLMEPFSATALVQAKENLSDVTGIVKKLRDALVDTPPLRLSDGGIFRTGFQAELDELKLLQTDSHSWVARYQVQLKEETQIKTLKVGYTKAFGYYIEVSRGQSDRIPDTFQRRQTLVNAERFITPELKEFEHKMLHAEEKMSALEYELFNALRQEAAGYSSEVRKIAHAVAQIDCLLSLADVAKKFNYARPLVDQSDIFHVEQGRHPVVEASLSGEAYIPNDVFLDGQDQRLYLITGPNMAGKSTFIRQVALIAIMAQMGSFVPARKAHLGTIDKVFSRIGASDDMSRGQSTFMVEMTETANILNNATNRSLVILDEIGRGTSTYDGISIAWAVAEYLLTEPGKKAKTLFATHYWELTELEQEIRGAVNYNVAVHESERGIVFLRKIIKGGTDKSYGIHVAKLAGLPFAVLKRAETMLQKLEKEAGRTVSSTAANTPKGKQLSLFSAFSEDARLESIGADLKNIDPNHLTPMEALKKILDWKGKLS